MSIKKIAELSGVSPATVSRVLNHPEYKCQSPCGAGADLEGGDAARLYA